MARDEHQTSTSEPLPRVDSGWALRIAQELTHVGVWLWKPGAGEVRWSDELYRIYGVSPRRTPSVDLFHELVHPEDREVLLSAEKSVKSGNPIPEGFRHRIIRTAGDVRWVKMSGTWLDSDTVLGTVQDITESVLTDLALQTANQAQRNQLDFCRETEQRLRAVSETVPFPIVITNLEDGRLLYCNAATERFFGKTKQQLEGSKAEWHYRDPAERRKLIEELQNHGYVDGREVVLVSAEGKDRTCSVTAQPITFDGKAALAGAAIDITRQKDTERKLRHALQQKEVLLREVHHRVRNSLQVVCSLIAMREDSVPSAVASILQDTRGQVHAMALALDGPEDLLCAGAVRLDDYLARLVAELRAESAGEIELSSQLDVVYIEVERAIPCGLIANELICNAFRHAFPDGSRGRVYVHLKRNEDRVALCVEDDGVGLDSRRSTDGSGLNLVRALARQLGGTLIENDENGHRVSLEFPLKPGEPNC